MKILMMNLSDQHIPPPIDVIRADLYISVPLAESLIQRGNEVCFLCPKGSSLTIPMIQTDIPALGDVIPLSKFIDIDDMGFRRDILHVFYTDLFIKAQHIIEKNNFDLLHIHTNIPLFELTMTKNMKIPVVFTLHSVGKYPEVEMKVMPYVNNSTNNYFISISNFQRKTFPALFFYRTVYNGIALSNFPYSEGLFNYSLLYAGRIRQNKGVKEAIETAFKTKNHIIITGALSSTDTTYFKNSIEPLLKKYSDFVRYDPQINRKNLYNYYQKSKVTLVPILWEEPFGLVMIESMACGTPIVAYARGSVPEIIKDGETGFIVNPSDDDIRGNWIVKTTGIDGLCEAVERIYAMPDEEYRQMRRNCRAHVEKHFTVERMVDEYENAFRNILKLKSKS